jgi:MFS family permease
MNFLVAFLLDYVKDNYPQYETYAYSVMFFTAAMFGLYSVYLLSNTPEPRLQLTQKNIFKLFWIPFRNKNFKNLMIFHAMWLFAINLASPFFTVYLLKMLGYPLSYVITLTIISQLTNIFFIGIWGKYSDKYSNKTIIQICAPIYLICILSWTFTTMPEKHALTIPLLVVIHIFSGISISGINLALSNIGFKLAPKGNGVIFLSARSLLNAVVGGIAPIIGGLFADFFAERELSWNLEWKSPEGIYFFNTLDLQQWDFFFVIAFIMGLISLQRLVWVKEEGEVEEKVVMGEILTEMRREIRTLSTVSGLRSMIYIPFGFFNEVKERIKSNQAEKNRDIKTETSLSRK